MENKHLRQQATQIKRDLFNQGYVDLRFVHLEGYHEIDKKFNSEEVISMFFRESPRWIAYMERELDRNFIDFTKLDSTMQRIKGSSESVGAKRVEDKTIAFMECCKEGNKEGCKETLEQVKQEYAILKEKLQPYYHLLRQAGPVETASLPN